MADRKPDPNAKPGTYSRYVESPPATLKKQAPYTTKSQRAKAVGKTPPPPPKRGRQPGENPPPPPSKHATPGVQLKGPAQAPGRMIPMPPPPPGRTR